ncbi:MAG TPA: hypothetical protein VFZ83_02620 [Acidimicrobiia bacterium]|nr:hypothetical protein [Acidimicrobiia bacterium]
MDVRKVGTSMVGVGAVAMVVGMLADALRHADDADLAATEGVLELNSLAHAVFFGGIVVAILGVLLMFFGASLYATSADGATPARRLLQVGAPLAAVALIAASAAVLSDTGLAEGSGTSGDVAAGADDGHGHAHGDDGAGGDDGMADDHAEHGGVDPETGLIDGGDHGDIIAATATGDSPCEQSGDPASPGQTGDGHGEIRGMVVQENLTTAERLQLMDEMAAAREVIEEFPTVADAEAGGYHKSTVYVPCIGAHYTNISRVPVFDPAAPSELLYDGTDPDSKIVGLSYLVYHPGGAPEGFAGPNDRWHQHNANGGLCLQGGLVVGGENTTEEECKALGGEKNPLEDIWMVHAWVVPGFECSWGVFAGECPELGGKIGGTAWD